MGQKEIFVLIQFFRETYAGSVGVEFMHAQNSDIIEFFIEHLEKRRSESNPSEGFFFLSVR